MNPHPSKTFENKFILSMILAAAILIAVFLPARRWLRCFWRNDILRA
ncbi:MAG: hypothetical protein LDL50_06980 [Chloroflexi bacterium]|nr:hypothetical protein [Chloroflexota bacterium]MCA2002585.1 hypothetical protein [Chloroflexota bacterium]